MVRDLRAPERFVSFMPWESLEAIQGWKAHDEFKERMSRVQAFVDTFAPTEAEVVARARPPRDEDTHSRRRLRRHRRLRRAEASARGRPRGRARRPQAGVHDGAPQAVGARRSRLDRRGQQGSGAARRARGARRRGGGARDRPGGSGRRDDERSARRRPPRDRARVPSPGPTSFPVSPSTGTTSGHFAGVPARPRRSSDSTAGRLLILIAGAPYPCPPAPYECAFHLHGYLGQRGLRDRTDLAVVTLQPMLMPNAGWAGSEWMAGQLAERNITQRIGAKAERVEAGRVVLADGSEERFDLLLTVPPHRPPAVVTDSGLVAGHGWIGVDAGTLATSADGVFAIGDVNLIPLANGLPLPKAGVMAELQGLRVARAIAAELGVGEPPAPFDGTGYCPVEVGAECRSDGSRELVRRARSGGGDRRAERRLRGREGRLRDDPARSLVRLASAPRSRASCRSSRRAAAPRSPRAPRPRGRPRRSSAAVRTRARARRRSETGGGTWAGPRSVPSSEKTSTLCPGIGCIAHWHSRPAPDRNLAGFQRRAVIGSTYAPRSRTSKWTCGPDASPVAPASPSRCAGAHAVADVDVDAREMRDERAHAAAVGDHDRVAPAAVAPAGVDDLSAPGRADRRSQAGDDVDASVEPGPAEPVAARDRGGHRPGEPLRRDGHRRAKRLGRERAGHRRRRQSGEALEPEHRARRPWRVRARERPRREAVECELDPQQRNVVALGADRQEPRAEHGRSVREEPCSSSAARRSRRP